MWSVTISPELLMMFQHMVPEPSMFKPLEMPCSTVFLDGTKFMKSTLSFDIQLEAPVSMHIGLPPGVKFIME